MTAPQTADTVVLIHGLWMTPYSWADWVTRYEAQGFRVLTPGYPGVEGGAEGVTKLREDPSPLAGLGARDIIDQLTELISGLDSQPIIMGHSFGGAFVQILLDHGFGAAGVSIDGAGVKGINTLPLTQVRSTFPVLKNPANHDRAVPITAEEFHYAFTNNLTAEESQAAYERYAVPVSGRMIFEAGFAALTPHSVLTVNFANDDRAPLLFISGGNDHAVPPPVQQANYKKHAKHSEAITAHKVFEGRDHFTCCESGWEAVADFALDWAQHPVAGEL